MLIFQNLKYSVCSVSTFHHNFFLVHPHNALLPVCNTRHSFNKANDCLCQGDLVLSPSPSPYAADQRPELPLSFQRQPDGVLIFLQIF